MASWGGVPGSVGKSVAGFACATAAGNGLAAREAMVASNMKFRFRFIFGSASMCLDVASKCGAACKVHRRWPTKRFPWSRPSSVQKGIRNQSPARTLIQ
jgi:hypothetical protein